MPGRQNFVERFRKTLLFIALFVIAGYGLHPEPSQAQRNPAYYDYPYNHLEWYTIESDHFLVHFQEGNSRPAQVASRIAEEIYTPITELYDYEPDQKISLLIIDRLDYSNGAAFFYDNKIEIWLPSLDTPLRGTHSWLRNVITHEFTHIVQLQASMKKSRRHPATYFQWLSYEDVRRPDVLYGFPRGIITYPFSGISMPAWLAEGTAQYMRDKIFYDDWDTHRDMLLRTRILDGTHLSLEKMGTFTSKTSLERELVYNQGFAFTLYLAERFGEQAIADITHAFSKRGVYDVRKAIQMATGYDGKDIFDDWINERTEYYTHFIEGREKEPENRKWIEPSGFFNFYAAFRPDGKQMAYLSNKNTDGGIAYLFIKDIDETSEEEAFETWLFEPPNKEHPFAADHLSDSPSGPNRNSLQERSATSQHFEHFGQATDTRSFRRFIPRASHQGITPHSHQCDFHNAPDLKRLETSFSYAPDGKKIAYSRVRLNKYGERYRDLYLYDIEQKKSRRLTFSERLQYPAWHPDGKALAAGKIEDGSINLYLYHIEEDTLHRLTHFQNGEQIYRPAWHPDGNSLFFAYADTGHRGIYTLPVSSASGDGISEFSDGASNSDTKMKAILVHPDIDYRNPVISHDGQWLYFSADYGSVFNIYRKSLKNGKIEQITNLTGGAFMPYPHPKEEKLLYSEYVSEGYKIALLDLTDREFASVSLPNIAVSAVSARNDENGIYDISHSGSECGHSHTGDTSAPKNTTPSLLSLNHFDDSDIGPFPEKAVAVADTGIYRYQLLTRGQSSERSFYRYEETFTSFQFYPVIRFDNYTRLRGDNVSLLRGGDIEGLGDNLWRDAKIGTYFASREMLERFRIFGGALFGPGSRPTDGLSNFFRPARLVNLDRDLFLEAEYTSLPFIQRHWSPTISVSFFNLRRNVSEGLRIEEFPHTASLPDTTAIDIAYNMWQLEVSLVSKINRWSLIDLGYYYSPYRVSTESFFSREFRQEVGGSTSRYYIGSTWSAAWMFDLSMPGRHTDIAPVGWRGLIRYRFEPSELLDSYDIRDGTLLPVYNKYRNHSIETDVRYGFSLLQQRFNLRTRLFSYFEGPDEFFYLDYIGGMVGMRSYPYFALGGNRTAFSQLSWFIPLKTDIYRQTERITIDKVFLRLFAEAGNGWGGPLDIDSSLKTGIGAELRIGLNSYYFFPSRFFISGAYGFNAYDIQLPDAFITETPSGRVSYGKQLLINFGLLFDFEF